MSEELKKRIVGAAVLLTVFSLVAWWIGSRGSDQEELPPSDAQIRNYDIRELERIAAAQSGGQAVPEPVLDVPIEPDELKAREAEVTSGTEKPVAESTNEETSQAGNNVEPSPEAAPEPVPVAEKTPPPAPEPKAAPKPEPKAEPVPEKPETSSNGNWVVQLASVTQKAGAERLAEKVRKKGWKSFVATGDVNGTTYFRVRVGPYAKREDADRAAVLVAKDMGQKVAVMPR